MLISFRAPATAEVTAADPALPSEAHDSKRDPSTGPKSSGADSIKGQQPGSRSQTPRARSPTGSPSGSPPIPSSMPQGATQGDYFSTSDVKQQQGTKMRTVRIDEPGTPSTQHRDDSTGPANRKTRGGSTRTTSASGTGVQVTLNDTGSWSDMANQGQTLVQEDGRKSSSMLGFLRSKKGRDKSPKPRERGVIGKEGARVVVGN